MLTTQEIRKAIKKNKWLIIITALLIGFLAYFTQNILPGDYEAEAVLIVTSNDDEPITYNKLILNEKLANVYSQFLESENLFETVAEKIDPDWDSKMVSKNFDYDVNPQGGVISLTYKDSNEKRAEDTLTLIAEEFRSYARNYLRMENIEYLQNVVVNKASKLRGIIFAVLGLIVGALIGILLLILRELISDKISSADDIRELDYEVLADLTKDKEAELAKVKRKIKTNAGSAVIGISELNKNNDNKNISTDISEVLNAVEINPQSEKNILEELKGLKANYPYILIKESNFNSSDAIDLAEYEDYKILLVSKNALKNDLKNAVKELKRLGIDLLGVIYY
ncbi:Wzz/FepE/Etk N-terminal domain-containing protein [uncultured Anaerococcus sp.]|uniref:Wzz/FepE/Etk N-terminal domain-containing protein n=1 Tax=uncultured Anaerococcus sp. TaxID=293428 RepID=UPI0025E0267B|nr:Wzz/FepE/Etk N-terminal domain-containing protein [uncultured Anaerococcus sp.]